MLNNNTLSVTFISALAVQALASMSLAAPLSFSDEAVARGVNYSVGGSAMFQFGSGMALVDFDGDDDLDIFLSGRSGGVLAIYENDGTGNFTDRSVGAGFTPIDASGVCTADYDNDGDQDIFIGGWLRENKLYRNDGGFVFTDVSAAAGVDAVNAAMGASWTDYDLDGYMDLYVSARTGSMDYWKENQLYHNNGDGTFTDVAVALGVDAGTDPSLLSAFFDFDRDGDDDLYVGVDKGSGLVWWNKLWRNDGGTFVDITSAANAEAYIDCMGMAIGDINNDSYFDIYMTDGWRNPLFMHDGVGAYVDQADAAGVTIGEIGWGTVFADFDNDTFLDLYVCNFNANNALFRGEDIANWPMTDEAVAAGVDTFGSSYCVAVGDIDNDGLLDMLVGSVFDTVKLYMNQSPDAATNHMVRFKLIGDGTMNTMCVGTCINVTVGGKTQTAEARAGVNYKVSEGRTVQFGLGTATEVPTGEVVWPGGVIRNLTGIPADRTWTIYSESRLGDVNNDGIIDSSEQAAAQLAFTGPGVKIEPGVEIFDMDGDFDIDDDDLALMVSCPADLTGDGGLDFFDVSFFLSNSVDYDGNTVFDFFDVSGFLSDFAAGCP